MKHGVTARYANSLVNWPYISRFSLYFHYIMMQSAFVDNTHAAFCCILLSFHEHFGCCFEQMSHFVQVLQDVQSKYPDIVSVTIDKTLMKVTQKNDIVEPVLQNLIQLCLWEAEEEQRNMGHTLM